MHNNRWVERAKNVLIALLAVILLALTVLALPVKTVTDTPWLAALMRPFASLMGISQGDLTDTPMADAGSVTGAAQPVSVSVRNPAGRTSFQYSFSTLDASFEQFGAAGRRWKRRRMQSGQARFACRRRSGKPRSRSAIRAKSHPRLPLHGCMWILIWTRRAAGSFWPGTACM